MVSIAGMKKAAVLAALYNAAAPRGMGFLHFDAKPMTEDEAASFLEKGTYFDYLKGRPLKLSLDRDDFDPWGYDRDNGGDGAAQRIVDKLRAGNVDTTQEHHVNMAKATEHAKNMIGTPAIIRNEHGVIEMGLGPEASEMVSNAVNKIEQATSKKE